MPKYGKGLNREIFEAVKAGQVAQPFSVNHVRQLAKQKGWDIPENYIAVCLANGASETHSITFKKYFIALGNGQYKVKPHFLL